MEVLEPVLFWVLTRKAFIMSTKLEQVPSVCFSVNVKMLDSEVFKLAGADIVAGLENI